MLSPTPMDVIGPPRHPKLYARAADSLLSAAFPRPQKSRPRVVEDADWAPPSGRCHVSAARACQHDVGKGRSAWVYTWHRMCSGAHPRPARLVDVVATDGRPWPRGRAHRTDPGARCPAVARPGPGQLSSSSREPGRRCRRRCRAGDDALQPWISLRLDDVRTATMVRQLVRRKTIGKLLLEPHLERRLGVRSNKIRFQGCGAARHDDHVHIQLAR